MLNYIEQIPPLINAACGVIFALFVFFLIRMRSEAAMVRADVSGFLDVLSRLPERTLETRHEGLQMADIERAHHAARERSRNVQRLWADLEMSFEPYRGAHGVQSWFAVRPVTELLPRFTVIDRVYQTSLHQAVPSVLTALGLLATFLAILLALEGVSVHVRSGAEIVEGIGGLINGLAGKFLSSIVALSLAVVFTLIEKRAERKLDAQYDSLLERAAVVVPALSPTRLLLDMQALSAKRTELLENFYGEMADRVVSLFRTEVIPEVAANFGEAFVDRCAVLLRPEPPSAGADTSPVALGAAVGAGSGDGSEVPDAEAALGSIASRETDGSDGTPEPAGVEDMPVAVVEEEPSGSPEAPEPVGTVTVPALFAGNHETDGSGGTPELLETVAGQASLAASQETNGASGGTAEIPDPDAVPVAETERSATGGAQL